ncbi:MAG: hypothetical protein B7Y40_05805 [Gammaproteobacteria bacterium 28-57-27]|nr:MAG: hypothetical protein B7Y40_05805 [Gammaproteobacteria bacterium 28-57-27]
MQHMNLKWLAPLAVTLTLASILSACGGDNAPATLASGQPVPPGTTTETSQNYNRVVVQAKAPGTGDFIADSDLGVILGAQSSRLTLYVFSKDAPGKSVCNISTSSQCANVWPPLFADNSAKEEGDYSIIKRDDGARQWAYRGYPLYFFNGDASHPADTAPGDNYGFLVNNVWFVVRPDPFQAGKALGTEVWLGKGSILDFKVNDEQISITNPLAQINSGQRRSVEGMTLYIFANDKGDGVSACNGGCATKWPPLYADLFSIPPSKDFSLIQRNNGTSQWAYKGKPLYFWYQDAQPGDALGVTVANWFLATR